jgi:hypothetical protein
MDQPLVPADGCRLVDAASELASALRGISTSNTTPAPEFKGLHAIVENFSNSSYSIRSRLDVLKAILKPTCMVLLAQILNDTVPIIADLQRSVDRLKAQCKRHVKVSSRSFFLSVASSLPKSQFYKKFLRNPETQLGQCQIHYAIIALDIVLATVE